MGYPFGDGFCGLLPWHTDTGRYEVLPSRSDEWALLLGAEEIVHRLEVGTLTEGIAELHQSIQTLRVSQPVAR